MHRVVDIDRCRQRFCYNLDTARGLSTHLCSKTYELNVINRAYAGCKKTLAAPCQCSRYSEECIPDTTPKSAQVITYLDTTAVNSRLSRGCEHRPCRCMDVCAHRQHSQGRAAFAQEVQHLHPRPQVEKRDVTSAIAACSAKDSG
mmetsp:Transcript_34695/g.61670  ORF Transcript_34695/g.61670 Transcript_34695/m.61670 type:complete len:145 (-) Transcript_34695:1032-1466(-)